MSTNEHIVCPRCGAAGFPSDRVCLSCGAELTHGPAHEGPPPPAPFRPFWSAISRKNAGPPVACGAWALGLLLGGLAGLGAVGSVVVIILAFANVGSSEWAPSFLIVALVVLGPTALALGVVGLGMLISSLGVRGGGRRARKALAWFAGISACLGMVPLAYIGACSISNPWFVWSSRTVPIALSALWALVSAACCACACSSAVQDYCSVRRTGAEPS
jgi:hypothetical protein